MEQAAEPKGFSNAGDERRDHREGEAGPGPENTCPSVPAWRPGSCDQGSGKAE